MSANPRGERMPRPELHAKVTELRDQGLLLREIAAVLGRSVSTVHDVLTDPTGEKGRERKHKRHGHCVDCGIETFNSGSEPRPRCLSCEQTRLRSMDVRKERSEKTRAKVGKGWTDEECFAALRSTAVGGVVSTTLYDAALKRMPKGAMPHRSGLIFRFGSWRKAVHAAGLKTSRESTPERYRNSISDKGLLLAIQDCAAAVGHWPGAREYEPWCRGGNGPHLNVIRQRFGSWLAALEAAMADAPDLFPGIPQPDPAASPPRRGPVLAPVASLGNGARPDREAA